LFYGHISGMDALARGLRNAAALKVRKKLPQCPFCPPTAQLTATFVQCLDVDCVKPAQPDGDSKTATAGVWGASPLSAFASSLQEAGQLDGLIADRYASWKAKGGLGQKIINGKVRQMRVTTDQCCVTDPVLQEKGRTRNKA
jgi:xylose isomerase